MDYSDIIKELNKIETDFPVYDWRVNDLQVWPYIRNELGFKLVELKRKSQGENIEQGNAEKEQMRSSAPYVKKNLLKRLVLRAKKYLVHAKYLVYEKKVEAGSAPVIFFATSSTVASIDGKWYNIFFGPIIDQLKKKKINYAVWEYKNNVPAKYPKSHIGYHDFDKYLYYTFSRNNLLYDNSSDLSVHLPRYEDFYEYITTYTGAKINFLQKEALLKEADYILKIASIFENLIKKKKTTICFITCYYFNFGIALCYACYKTGAMSVDMQHGSQANWFPYSGWSHAGKGYNSLPKKFWNWTKDEVEMINAWALQTKSHLAFNGGNTWLQKWEKNDDLSKFYMKELNELAFDKKNTYLLFTAQPLGNELIPIELEHAIKHSPENYKWLIRIHPRMLSNTEKLEIELSKKGIAVLTNFYLPSILPLPLILRHVDIHVTQESSTVIEAEMMHVPSVIISEAGCAFYPGTLARGLALYAADEKNILQAIDHFLYAKKTDLSQNGLVDYSSILDNMIAEHHL